MYLLKIIFIMLVKVARFLHNFARVLSLNCYYNNTIIMFNKSFITILVAVALHQHSYAQTDTTLTVVPAENVTIATDQNALWKSGKAKYPAKPKNMWEGGIHFGHFLIDGDVDPRQPLAGFGCGLHLRRAVHYAFSIRLDALYGLTKGLETQPYGSSLEPEPFYKEPDGELRDVFNGYNRNNPWFPSYKTHYFNASIQGVLNIGNLLFHKESNKWNWYLVLGISGDHNITKLDLRDGSGNIYSNLLGQINYSQLDFNTRQGRKDIKAGLRGVYDGTYETTAFKKRGIFRIGDDINVHFGFNAAVGVSRKINKRFNISLEHELISSDNDYLDGIHWRTDVDQTNNNDIGHYTNLRLGINLGNFKKKVEPLYWINPLDAVFSDIAELKQRPKFDLNDSDQDGVIDLLDQEQETPAGAPVDTRGITLDSDNDGQADYKDEEPYSAPGYPVNEKGIAQIPVQPKITEDDVNRIVDQKMGAAGIGGPEGSGGPGGNAAGKNGCCNPDWFLPMVHFNLDEYCVKPQYYTQLHHVATVMLSHPDLKVTAFGHTDVRNSNGYNNVLSYNRAKASIEYLVSNYNIPRERFVLMYGGEESPFGKDASNHYINRRVEFRVSKPEDKEMARPEGPEAGDCHKKRMRKSGKVKTDNGTDEDKKSGY